MEVSGQLHDPAALLLGKEPLLPITTQIFTRRAWGKQNKKTGISDLRVENQTRNLLTSKECQPLRSDVRLQWMSIKSDAWEGSCLCCSVAGTANLSWSLDISGPMGPFNPPWCMRVSAVKIPPCTRSSLVSQYTPFLTLQTRCSLVSLINFLNCLLLGPAVPARCTRVIRQIADDDHSDLWFVDCMQRSFPFLPHSETTL